MRPNHTVVATILLVGCAGGGAPLPPPSPRPAAETVPVTPDMRYRFAAWDSVRLELVREDSTIVATEVGQQTQYSNRQLYFTISTSPIGRGPSHLVVFALDSLRQGDGGLAIDSASMNLLSGLRWTATRDASGRLSNLAANRPGGLVAQLEPSVWLLYPLLPDSGASAGLVWSDTTTRAIQVDRFVGEEEDRSKYSADTMEVRGGQRLFPIRVESFFSRSGVSELGGQRLEMKGIGIRSSTYYLYLNSGAVSAVGVDTTSLTVTIPTTGVRIPAQQIGRFRIRPLIP